MTKRAALPTVCLVLSEHLTNHYVGPLARGAVAAAAQLGVRLILYSPINVLMDRRDLTAAELPLLPRRADAYLVPANISDEVLAPCRAAGATLLTYAGVRAGLPSIGPDNRAGARAATAHLLAHGRRRIVHLAGLPDSDEAHERLAGYRDALEEAGIAYDERLVAYGHFRIQEAEDATAALLRRGIPFDGVFAANDLEAQGAITVLARSGLRVPDDVAVVGFDDSIGSDTLDPPLSTVRQSAFQLGWDALELLARSAGRPLPERTLVPVRLVVRRSCGCEAPAGAAPDLAGLLGAGQGPLVSDEQARAWAAPVIAALDAGSGWERALDVALAQAEALGWYAPALRSVVDSWQARHSGVPALELALAAKDRLAGALEELRLRREIGRDRRLNAITYVIDLLREYGYEQSSESALRYMVNSGPKTALVAQPAAFGNLVLALRVDAEAGAETWQGAGESFPPTGWIAPGDAMMLMPLDAGAQQAMLVGLVERAGPAYLELNDLLLRSINTYRSVTTLHETLRELDAARSVQLSLLPRQAPSSELYELAGATRTARQVGGDLYGYYPRPDGALALALGDVAGKGLPAALLMSACITALAGTIPAGLPPGATLAQIHRVLYPSVGRAQNAAVCLVFLDGDQARVANAGLIAPFVCGDAGVRAVDVGGLPLGTPLAGQLPYAEAKVRLARGDLLVLVSDGIVEAMNERGELFGFERLAHALAEGPRASAQAMLDHVLAQVAAFAGDTEPHDDMAIVVARYR